jgi:hypothetical protein
VSRAALLSLVVAFLVCAFAAWKDPRGTKAFVLSSVFGLVRRLSMLSLGWTLFLLPLAWIAMSANESASGFRGIGASALRSVAESVRGARSSDDDSVPKGCFREGERIVCPRPSGVLR